MNREINVPTKEPVVDGNKVYDYYFTPEIIEYKGFEQFDREYCVNVIESEIYEHLLTAKLTYTDIRKKVGSIVNRLLITNAKKVSTLDSIQELVNDFHISIEDVSVLDQSIENIRLVAAMEKAGVDLPSIIEKVRERIIQNINYSITNFHKDNNFHPSDIAGLVKIQNIERYDSVMNFTEKEKEKLTKLVVIVPRYDTDFAYFTCDLVEICDLKLVRNDKGKYAIDANVLGDVWILHRVEHNLNDLVIYKNGFPIEKIESPGHYDSFCGSDGVWIHTASEKLKDDIKSYLADKY